MSDDRNPDTRDEIVIEGERHFHNSGGQYRNPYPIYSDAFNRFERGWTQALKKSNSDPIKRPPSESEYPLLSESSKRSIEQQVAEYKSRKG